MRRPVDLFSCPPRGARRVTRPWGLLAFAAMVSGVASTGCHGAEAQPQAMPPLPVNVVRLAERPINEEDEYLASLTSRRSITLYAQVSGYIRKIPQKPGDKVRQGALLIEIDPGQQASTLKSLAAGLETRKATRDFAVHNDESSKTLVESGLLSSLEYQQRHSQRRRPMSKSPKRKYRRNPISCGITASPHRATERWGTCP